MTETGNCEKCGGRLHVSRVEEKSFVDRRGRQRTSRRQVWERCDCIKEKIEKERLKEFAVLKPMSLAPLKTLLKVKHAVVVTKSLTRAQRVAGTRVRLDKRPYMSLSGSDLMEMALDDESVNTCYPNSPHMYLFFSYGDSPNQLVCHLIVEMMSRRIRQDLHCWLFVSNTFAGLRSTWGPTLQSLDFLPEFDLREGDEEKGPVSTTKTPLPGSQNPNRKKS